MLEVYSVISALIQAQRCVRLASTRVKRSTSGVSGAPLELSGSVISPDSQSIPGFAALSHGSPRITFSGPMSVRRKSSASGVRVPILTLTLAKWVIVPAELLDPSMLQSPMGSRGLCQSILCSFANHSFMKTPVALESNIAGVETVLFNPTSCTKMRKCEERLSNTEMIQAEMPSYEQGDGVSEFTAVEAGVSKLGRGTAALVRTLSKNLG